MFRDCLAGFRALFGGAAFFLPGDVLTPRPLGGLEPSVGRFPRQTGKRVHPRKVLPARGPRVAMRSVIGESHKGQRMMPVGIVCMPNPTSGALRR